MFGLFTKLQFIERAAHYSECDVFANILTSTQVYLFRVPPGPRCVDNSRFADVRPAPVVEVTPQEQIAARIAEITGHSAEQSSVEEAVQITGGKTALVLDYLSRLVVRGTISNDELLKKIGLYAHTAYGIPSSDSSRQSSPRRG